MNRKRRHTRDRAKGLALLLGTLSLAQLPLLAHATLIETNPPANARLEESPSRVHLVFNEGIEPVFNDIRVLNQNGDPVQEGEAALSRNRSEISVELRDNLPNGIYTVTWRATSSDGHQIGGNFGFSVGEDFEASAMVADSGSAQSWPSLGMTLVRWVFLLSLMMAVGGFFFAALVLRPLLGGSEIQLGNQTWIRIRRNFMALCFWSWLVLCVAAALNLLFKSAAMAGSGIWSSLDSEVLGQVLSSSQFGRMWALGTLPILLMGILYGLLQRLWPAGQPPKKGGPVVYGGAAAGALLLGTVANSGHAASVRDWQAAALAADALHLLASAVWVAGLVYLLGMMRSFSGVSGSSESVFGSEQGEAESRARLMGLMVPRFSRLAQISVIAILITGAYTTWIHLPAWSAFWTSWWGGFLSLKLLLVVPLLLIGAVNLRVIKPRLQSYLSEKGAQALESIAALLKRFYGLVRTEVILAVLIMGVVAVLTNLSPAAEAKTPGITQVRAPSDVSIGLHISPNQIGHNTFHIVVTDSEGQAINDLDNLALDVKLTDIDMPSQRIEEAEALPEGGYQAEFVFGMSGTWRITVRALEKGSSDQKVAIFENYLP